MQIYLLRHGIAEERRPGGSDEERALTSEGREKLRRVLARARGADVEPSLILTSPLVRAVQTAEIAAQVLGYKAQIVRTDALLAEAHPAELWNELRTRRDETAILAAGHEPHMSAAAAFLLGCATLAVDMKKAALLRLDIDRLTGDPHGVLKWLLTPGVA